MNDTGRRSSDDELTYDRGDCSEILWAAALLVSAVAMVVGQIVGLDISIVVCCAAAFGFAAALWLNYRFEAGRPPRRSEALKRVAGQLGFTFQASVSSDQVEELGRITDSQPSARQSQRASNLLCGSYEGVSVRVLDQYVRRPGGPEGDDEQRRSVVIFSDARGMPEFRLIPRRSFDRLGYKLYADVFGANADGFSRNYRLEGKTEPAECASFDAHVTGFFADNPDWHVACDRCTLVVWREAPEPKAHFRLTPQQRSGYVAPESIPRLVSQAVAIRRLFHPA